MRGRWAAFRFLLELQRPKLSYARCRQPGALTTQLRAPRFKLVLLKSHHSDLKPRCPPLSRTAPCEIGFCGPCMLSMQVLRSDRALANSAEANPVACPCERG